MAEGWCGARHLLTARLMHVFMLRFVSRIVTTDARRSPVRRMDLSCPEVMLQK